MSTRVRLAKIARIRFSLVTPLVLGLCGCLEEDVRVDLREDGSGTVVVSGGLTEKATRIMSVIDKDDGIVVDLHLGPDDFTLRKPGDAEAASLATKGLRVRECTSQRDATKVASRVAVEFDRVPALQFLDGLRIRNATSRKPSAAGAARFELAQDKDSTWTLSVTTPPVELSGGSGGGAAPGQRLDVRKLERKMLAVADLAVEGLRWKGALALGVPGEVVEASPEEGLTKAKDRCAWKFDTDGLLSIAVAQGFDPSKGGEVGLPAVTFRVRFRMPDGKSFPEGSFTKLPPAEPAKPGKDRAPVPPPPK
jgi:hypothetical protein